MERSSFPPTKEVQSMEDIAQSSHDRGVEDGIRKAREVELNPKGSERYKILTIPPTKVREIQLSTKNSLHKRPNSSNGNGEEFINELGTIGHIHHVNVVRLVGFYADGFRRALVYEFFSSGCKTTFHQRAKRLGSLVWMSCKILP
ncbi:hypothetical protein L3X38_012083 [Prunus dulcis]|uniref:Serine-threonine/tyrosine-protein kinase catalytic domain-containing protein n=1 Tax=Prunus dulcis TaxID=3755 RepID=A0AAD4WL28_PRUDU|nr:hypothetical protein L3X38_012083 [Prunus dulcis]